VAGVTRFFHRLWVIVAAVRDRPGVVFEVCLATPLPYSLLGSGPGPCARFVGIVPAVPRPGSVITAARPMITERKQPISCGISMKTEILRDLAAPSARAPLRPGTRPSCSPRATKSSALV